MFYLRKKPKEKFREVVELFDEKTNEIVRVIRFNNPKDFNNFLEDFKLMRYPGYSWRYGDKKKFRIHNKKYNEVLKEK
jgi:hypothetical protein